MSHRPVNRWRSLAQGQKTRSRVLPPSHSGAAGEKHCWWCLGCTRPTSAPVFRGADQSNTWFRVLLAGALLGVDQPPSGTALSMSDGEIYERACRKVQVL